MKAVALSSLLVVVAAVSVVGCTHATAASDERSGNRGGEEQKLPADVVTLKEVPLRDGAEYLAQLVSRHQVALYPQVVGVVNEIAVKPGDLVKQGATLLVIDPRKEAANLAAMAADKAQQVASLELSRSIAKRSHELLGQGIIGQQQYEQDKGAVDVAEQVVRAKQAAIDAQNTQLTYYRIVAPFDGIVGDIPVKIGDLATTTTKLTSVADNRKLEVYVYVPVEMLPRLGKESRVEVLGVDAKSGDKAIATAPISFIASEADPTAQVVLVKALIENTSAALRVGQIVRVRIVFRTHPGVQLPLASVVRQSGQYFVFVAEGPSGATVAHQRPVELGELDDNHYDVVKGLVAGDRVVVSQLQKLHDGAAIDPTDPSVSAAASASAPAAASASAPSR